MVKRIAAIGETFSIAGWREDAGFLLFHFPTWAKARPMQHWIDRSGIARRPMPTPLAWARSHACSSSVRHRTRDNNKPATRTTRANVRAFKILAMRSYFFWALLGSFIPHLSITALTNPRAHGG
jgi:hypothetical protein